MIALILNFHDKFGVLSCVLEFIQNALDALQKNKKQTFVRIRTVFVKFNIFENSFLTKEFKNLLPYFSSSSSKSIVDEKDILCLVMEDYNTTGILGDPSIYKAKLPNGEHNSIHQFNNEVGGNRKIGDAKKGGSEGEGRETFCYSSDISTFFYYTLREDGSDFFMGINFCGTFDYAGSTYKPFSHFGSTVESKDKYGRDFSIPINEPAIIKKLKSIFQIDRKEPGTSIIIPYIDRRVTFPKIQETICTKYRVPIIRGDVKIQIQNKIIDATNIENIYKENYCKTDNEKKTCEEFFSFIKKTSDNSLQKYKLSITPGDPRNIKKK